MRLAFRWIAASITLAAALGLASATAARVNTGDAGARTVGLSSAESADAAKANRKARKKARKAEKRAAKKARKKAAKRERKRAEEARKARPVELAAPKPEVKREAKRESRIEGPTLECAKPMKRKGLRDRWQPRKSAKYAFFAGRDPRRLVLKLRDDACATAEKGRLVTSNDRALVQVARAIAERAPGAHVTRRFQASDKLLEAARREGEKNSGQHLADMRQYYWILLDESDHLRPLSSALVGLAAVENVYSPSLPVTSPGDIIEPVTPDFSGNQGYRNAAPGGLDIDFAASVVGPGGGGTGGNSKIADLEYAWNTGHEDLSVKGPDALFTDGAAGEGFSPFGTNHHGTAVAGVISADPDAPGIRGVAPAAGLFLVPTLADAAASRDVAQAILDVAVVSDTRKLGPTGVVLIESQTAGPNGTGVGQLGQVPVEYEQAEFDAIQLATSLDVVVIEVAANGSQDLDRLSGANGHPTYDLFDPSKRHSGAILVGAGSSTAPHTPRPASNVGVRVDTYAWGQNIFTLGYGAAASDGFPAGNADPNQLYTTSFGGTSGASAILAGVAAIFESVHFVNHQSLPGARSYDSTAMRLLLRTTGTASSDPSGDRIGRQPDMAEQLPLLEMGPNLGSVFSGDAGAGTGTALAPIDDLDGDGIREIIVGSAGSNTVSVYAGGSGDVLVSFSGGSTGGNRFGAAVAAIDDIDGDGLQDVLVGAPGTSRVTLHSSATGQTLLQYLGEQDDDEFGAAVASQGDLDGDGFPEIVVGAPLSDFFGPNGGRVYRIATGTNEREVLGDGHAHAKFGAVVVTGDVLFGDGQLDILIGAPNDPGFADNNAGRVYLFQASGSLSQFWTGAEEFAEFGSSIALIGDRTGDGRSEFAVGSPGEDFGRGSVRIYSGHSNGLQEVVVGQANGARFGQSVAGPGDVDGDGIVDLLVGAPAANGSSGAVFAISLGSSAPVRATYSAENTGDGFGTTLMMVGDVNGDGNPEFVSGAPGSDRGGDEGGAAYLFVMPRTGFTF